MTEYLHKKIGVIRLQRRRGCKRISICVGRSGNVTVSYPWFVLKCRVLAFINQKEEWIVETQARVKARSASPAIESGYKTRSHTLRIVASDKSYYRISDKEIVVGLCGEDCSSEEAQALIRTAIIETLRAEAHATLPAMVEEIAKAHGFSYNGITIKNIRSKWGSCSRVNHLNFSLFLMLLPDHLIRFVILHELCHTTQKNHSVKFHEQLDALCGGQEREFNRQLRNYRTAL